MLRRIYIRISALVCIEFPQLCRARDQGTAPVVVPWSSISQALPVYATLGDGGGGDCMNLKQVVPKLIPLCVEIFVFVPRTR